jgi:ubiquinone/menaquinone biosynthesis C-methylase UbiE
MPMTDRDAVKNVFEQWALYDAVVRHDYMRHAELSRAMAAWAESFGRPLRVVDLGCGDAGLATSGFANANVEHYLGVDLSESSTERARGRLAIWPGRAEVACGDLAETLHRLPDDSANVALASYSLHHFSTTDKRTLIREVWRLLEPGGALLWIDIVRNEDESRQEYIDRITAAMLHEWVGLTVEQRQTAVDHVRQSDFPEQASWMLEQTRAAGFSVGDTLFQDEFYAAWAFMKPRGG